MPATPPTYNAPLGTSVKWVTAAVCLLLPAFNFVIAMMIPGPPIVAYLMVGIPIAIILFTSFFMIRGFTIGDGVLFVHRPGWIKRIPLTGLKTATFDAEALKGSIRIVGNGGLFAFNGLFWNRSLGRFRAYVTDPKRSVILQWPDRIVVVSPDDPARFVDELRARGQLTARPLSG